MSYMIVSATDFENVLNGKQKYCISTGSYNGLVDKKMLKQCEKDNKKIHEQINKENRKKCKTCVHLDKNDPVDISDYTYKMSDVCIDCGRGFDWKNYEEKK